MTKLIIVAIVAAGIASPALAQSFDPDAGTGNTLGFSYQPGGAQQQISARENGLTAYARVSHRNVGARTRNGLRSYAMTSGNARAGYSFNPGETGGGSTGYNFRVLQH